MGTYEQSSSCHSMLLQAMVRWRLRNTMEYGVGRVMDLISKTVIIQMLKLDLVMQTDEALGYKVVERTKIFLFMHERPKVGQVHVR
jgi:hypothetical protein